MVGRTVRLILGVVIVGGVAVGACALSDDQYADANVDLAKACSGQPAAAQLENALFNIRARSDGGGDPICSPATIEDDDSDALQLSASASHDHARAGGFSRR